MKQFLKLNWLHNYLYYVALPFIPYIIHELSHYIVAIIIWLFNPSVKFPKLIISQKASIEGRYITTWFMYIQYHHTGNDWKIKIIASAPLFTYILIGYFAITNGIFTTLLFIYNTPYLFLSVGDINCIFNNNQTKSNE